MRQIEGCFLLDNIISAELEHALSTTKVSIIGNTYASEIATANLIGLGIKDITVFGERKSPRIFQNPSAFYSNLVSDLNYYESNNEDEVQEFDPDIILNFSGEARSFQCNTIHVYQYKDRGEVVHNAVERKDKIVDSIHIGGVCAALAVDELRKLRAPLSPLDTITEKISYIASYEQKPRNVLAIGSGGIGNYFLLNATDKKHTITLVDHDIFEKKNNHRQPFSKPGMKKANRLAECLPYIHPITERFDDALMSKFDEKKYCPDIVVGCVDNVETRIKIFEYANKRNIPYIDGGVGYTRGQVQLYNLVPQGKDAPKKSFSCAHIVNPSIVIPNCIIGLHLATIINHVLDKKNYSFHFDSMMTSRVRDAQYFFDNVDES